MRPHIVYGYQLSYFTRKVEAAYQLLDIRYAYVPKTIFNMRRVEAGGGTQQVPVIRLPDGRWMSDSTPIIEHLDSLSSGLRLFPSGRDGIVTRLCEEWLDEWFPRTVIHFRWNYPSCSAYAKTTLAREMLPYLPGPLRSWLGRQAEAWGRKAVRALALDKDVQQHWVENMFEEVMTALEHQLRETRYCLGNRPCAADAVLLGALRAHLAADPEPLRRLQAYPQILQWAASPPEWSDGDQLDSPESPGPFAECLLSLAAGDYRLWALGNARALQNGEKAFVTSLDGREVSFRTRAYPEQSRQALVSWLGRLSEPEQSVAAQLLKRYQLEAVFNP